MATPRHCPAVRLAWRISASAARRRGVTTGRYQLRRAIAAPFAGAADAAGRRQAHTRQAVDVTLALDDEHGFPAASFGQTYSTRRIPLIVHSPAVGCAVETSLA